MESQPAAPGFYCLEAIASQHREGVLDIMNYFIATSMAAFSESAVGYDFYDRLELLTRGYPTAVLSLAGGQVVGMGFLRPYHLLDSFRRTAETAYFILPGHSGQGLGAAMLAYFERGARQMGVDSLLAAISSHNLGSIRFHQRHGFVEAGRFRQIGRKHGKDFDVVWMQKRLT